MTTTPPAPEQPSSAAGRPGPPWSGRPDGSVPVLRWVIVSLALALGVVLLVTGHVLIGGLLTVLAVLRMVLVTKTNRRRKEFEQWRQQRTRPWSPPGA